MKSSPTRLYLWEAAKELGTTTKILSRLSRQCNYIHWDHVEKVLFVYQMDMEKLKVFLEFRAPGPVKVVVESQPVGRGRKNKGLPDGYLDMLTLAARVPCDPSTLYLRYTRGDWPKGFDRHPACRKICFSEEIVSHLKVPVRRYPESTAEGISLVDISKLSNIKFTTLRNRLARKNGLFPEGFEIAGTNLYRREILRHIKPALSDDERLKMARDAKGKHAERLKPLKRLAVTRKEVEILQVQPLDTGHGNPVPVPAHAEVPVRDIAIFLIQNGFAEAGCFLIKERA